MFDIGGQEMILILLAILIFFGPKKLPELAQSFGRGLREFKKAQREFTDHINSAFEEEQRKSTTVPRPNNAVPRQVAPPPPPVPSTIATEGEPSLLPNRSEEIRTESNGNGTVASESATTEVPANGSPINGHAVEGNSTTGESQSSDQTSNQ